MSDDVVGEFRRWAGLVPTGALEPIADVLFVERGLGITGLIAVGGPKARAIRRQHFVDEQDLAGRQRSPFELRVGDQDAATARVTGGMAVDFDAQIAQPRGKLMT